MVFSAILSGEYNREEFFNHKGGKAVIEVADLKKSYGSTQALKGVSFQIQAGEIVGLLGPNGAGKTTIIKTLTGFLQPDSGTVTVNGFDVLTQSQEVQKTLGYLPEQAPLYPEMTIQSYLKMMAELRGIKEEDQAIRITEVVQAVGLGDYLTRPLGHLSKGYRQRVGIAQAIIHQPKLLILDEPTIGLDPTQIIEIRQLIKRLSKNSTILFSTHILPEVEVLCDRVIILMGGEIKADARLEDLARSSSTILVLNEKTFGVEKALEQLVGVQKVETFRVDEKYPAFRLFVEQNGDVNLAVYKLAVERNWQVRELRRDTRMLETVFSQLTTGA